MDYTASEVLERVKRYAAINADDPAFTTDNLLKLLNDSYLIDMVPFIMSFNEEYFVTYQDTAISTTTESYALPTKAIGNVLRELKAYKANTNESDADYVDLPWVSPVSLGREGTGFYIRDNKIQLLSPTDYSGWTLRAWYFRQPNELILSTTARQITIIDTVLFKVTVSSAYSPWGSSGNFDLISNSPQFAILAENAAATVASNVLTFTSLPAGLAVGDWVCTTGYSPVPQIPFVCFPLLAQFTVTKVLETLTDRSGLQEARTKSADMQARLIQILSPRVKGETKKLKPQVSLFDYV